ncbi:MAG: bifunctional folylpolyglutamate synthase/dihydrofolate synthase [Thermoflexaceae bacterium]|nr:bifunctional folylpolyglutamate synthase/dihydrofolate synthase [Thermoflexaceae bacterium]
MNYNEAVNYISTLRKFGNETGAVRAKRALSLLGNPEKNLNIIHVAGTNGKGSVCAYVSGALLKLGFQTGMFSSPHLVRVNERIRINGEMITDEEFLQYFNRVNVVSEELKKQGFDGLAFFDFVFVMAVLFYADRKPDYVVMETGLGGRTDATAALSRKLVSVITSLSLDHTEILGDTLPQIAEEKSGIIVQDTPVVYWKTDEETSDIIENTAKKCNSRTYFVDENSFKIHNLERKYIDFSFNNRYYENSMFSIRNAGLYQVMNASVALEVLSVLDAGKQWDERKIREAFRETCWEGRMEEVEKHIYVDGAHNPDGIRRFLETVRSLKNDGKMYLLFGAVCEKNHEKMIQEICNAGCFDGYVITQIPNHRALEADIMVNEFRRYTDKPVFVRENHKEAYTFAKALMKEGDMLYCAGSLYLVGAIKELIGE